MNPRIAHVTALPDYQLDLIFANQERRRFDVKTYLNIGVFEELQDLSLFNAAKPANGSISWPNDLDLDPDRLYLESYSLE
jgi:Protein of unknown function (DUF2442)